MPRTTIEVKNFQCSENRNESIDRKDTILLPNHKQTSATKNKAKNKRTNEKEKVITTP